MDTAIFVFFAGAFFGAVAIILFALWYDDNKKA